MVFRYLYIFILLFVFNASSYSQDKNPFSIIRSAEDTIVEQEPIAPVVENIKLEGENPFSVSHIPIRKNQYKEIERLAISNRSVEENISLGYLPIWVLIVSLCLLAFLLFTKSDHILILFRSMMNDNFMKMTNYEQDGGRSMPYLVGYIIFIINIALFIFLYITKVYEYNSRYFYFILLAACLAFFFGKQLVNVVISSIFEFSKESKLYDFTTITVYNLLGIFIIGFNVVLVFGRTSWVQAIATLMAFLFIISLLSRYYKGIRIGQSQLNSYFVHFFLYFCAFEFSPWVIVYTIVKDLV